MTLLHVYFALQDQQAFQRLLNANIRTLAAPGTSGGKSRKSPIKSALSCDVNAKDELGRTVLHLACSSIEPKILEFVRLLLVHPLVNVNVIDKENHWSALHRAFYHGNIAAARLLLQCADIDIHLKDLERNTPFDLYNSTLDSTRPSLQSDTWTGIFTWGTNKNAALGHEDGDDRTYPDQVIVPAKGDPETNYVRYAPIGVKQIVMSRLHTAVVTSENSGNLRVCGYGSGGRLGPGQHTQYSLIPLQQITHAIVTVALGQDHTLALTKSGEVLSWGLNRFAQLGYIVEQAPTKGLGWSEEPIQASPKKIAGPLKKEVVVGIAACKTASVCWTSSEVFTWGTNNGQLGYDKATQPVQILPRKVSKITQPVLSITITEYAMACLLQTHEVIYMWNDYHFKLNFPAAPFPSIVQVYRPRQAIKDIGIVKVTSSDNYFAALSSSGELFTFTALDPSSASGDGGSRAPKPQRQQCSAAKDVALGIDGSIILCTESGHVFVRSRNVKSGQGGGTKPKFQRVPYIQRVTNVCANNSGAFGAIRRDYLPPAIPLPSGTIAQDLAEIHPYLCSAFLSETRQMPSFREDSTAVIDGAWSANSPPLKDDTPRVEPMNHPRPPRTLHSATTTTISPDFEEDEEDASILEDIQILQRLFTLLSKPTDGHSTYGSRFSYRADIMLRVHSLEFPAHRIILAMRSPALFRILSRSENVHEQKSKIHFQLEPQSSASILPRLSIAGCHPISVLILLAYIYADKILAIWDSRIASILAPTLEELHIRLPQIKSELQDIAMILELPLLAQALKFAGKRTPDSSLSNDVEWLLSDESSYTSSPRENPLSPDVVLQLLDKDVMCHSLLLRARSPLFASFFGDQVWTINRWDAQGIIKVDMKHLSWRVMQFVLKYIYCDVRDELFDAIAFVDSVDELVEFMFEVLSAVDELLLDDLVLLCSRVILRHLDVNNVCYILTEAAHFNAAALLNSVQHYVIANMELLLESHMLDDLAPALLQQLARFVRQEQTVASTSDALAESAVKRNYHWLELQDIPHRIVPIDRPSPEQSPSTPTRKLRPVVMPLSNQFLRFRQSDDEVFEMDDVDPLPSLKLESTQDARTISSGSQTVWKGKSVAPRIDMKTIMAEAASDKTAQASTATSSSPGSKIAGLARNSYQKEWKKTSQSLYESPEKLAPTPRPSDSPWRIEPRISPLASTVNTSPLKSGDVAEKDRSMRPIPRPVNTSSPPKAPATPPQTRPGLGPVFSPSRQPSSSKPGPSAPRRIPSNGPAWTLPPPKPVRPVTGPVTSFVAIQQLQLDQGAAVPKDKRSLLEIQQEEQDRQAEADFLKWWAAEEERLKSESMSPSQPEAPAKKNKKKVHSKKKTSNPDQGKSDTRPSSDKKS